MTLNPKTYIDHKIQGKVLENRREEEGIYDEFVAPIVYAAAMKRAKKIASFIAGGVLLVSIVGGLYLTVRHRRNELRNLKGPDFKDMNGPQDQYGIPDEEPAFVGGPAQPE